MANQKCLLSFLSGIILLAGSLCSCTSTRHTTYMQGSFDTAALSKITITDPTIQKGDILGITVYSDNPQATALYNQYSGASVPGTPAPAGGGGGSAGGGAGGGSTGGTASAGTATSSPAAPGYLVDGSGDIEFQGIGTLHVEGMTRRELKDTLTGILKDTFLKNPYFNIRFLNLRVTMLGELERPGVYTIPGEHVSILEAVGMAGDMTIYGRRENVMVIRQKDGKREFARLDFTKPDIMASPYFYLQQNDIVYVEANKVKVASTDLTVRNITVAATIVTTIALVVSLLRN